VRRELDDGPRTGGARVVGRSGDHAVPDHVVDDDDRPDAAVAQRGAEVAGVVGLVGVDEREVERLLPLKSGDQVRRRADPDLYLGPDACRVQVRAGDRGVVRVDLERDQPALTG
jgi:hypothetical protein